VPPETIDDVLPERHTTMIFNLVADYLIGDPGYMQWTPLCELLKIGRGEYLPVGTSICEGWEYLTEPSWLSHVALLSQRHQSTIVAIDANQYYNSRLAFGDHLALRSMHSGYDYKPESFIVWLKGIDESPNERVGRALDHIEMKQCSSSAELPDQRSTLTYDKKVFINRLNCRPDLTPISAFGDIPFAPRLRLWHRYSQLSSSLINSYKPLDRNKEYLREASLYDHDWKPGSLTVRFYDGFEAHVALRLNTRPSIFFRRDRIFNLFEYG